MMVKILRIFFLACMVVPVVLYSIRIQEYGREDKKLEQVGELMERCVKDMPEELPAAHESSGPDKNGAGHSEILSYLNERDFVDVMELRKTNPDVDGVLRVDGTDMDYPVMYTEDMEYYIHRDFYGQESAYGSIFMDSISEAGCPNKILYGHHMRNGAMFGNLEQYAEDAYAQEHAVIKYISDEKIELYRAAAVFNVSAEHEGLLNSLPMYYESQVEDLNRIIKECQGTVYDALEPGEDYISLVTCEYTHPHGRCLVIGKKIAELQR